MSKRRDAPYRSGACRGWRKISALRTRDGADGTISQGRARGLRHAAGVEDESGIGGRVGHAASIAAVGTKGNVGNSAKRDKWDYRA